MHVLSHCHKWAFSHSRRHRGHFVLQKTDTGHFVSEWISGSASSKDGHTMPWVQLMLICARPWWWSKWRCDSSSGSNAQSHNFHTTPWKHVKPKRWNRWKDYSLLISCCPSRSESCQKCCSYALLWLLCSCVRTCACVPCQTQAEAHYKGHKHARKLKALETQRNRQKNGHSPSKPGKDRDRDRAVLGGGTVPTDSHLKDTTGINHSFFF